MADGRLLFDTKLDDTGVKKGLQGIGNIAKGAMSIASKAFIGGAVALGGLGAVAFKMGADFEQQMSRVQAISGATERELKLLNDQALKLGADTSFSAKEAAAGMENLASAGFSVNEIMKAMPGLLDLAAISGGDVAMASEVAASSLRAFGLDASKAGHVADVFARAAADTNAEVHDMGEAMKYVGPVAKAMGLSLEETAASIGIMSDAGIKGSQAGTALRGSLSRLAKPTKAMSTVMDGLGISFYDAQGNMLPLAGIIRELEKGTAGLTQEQKNHALVTLFGQESLSGMLALIDAGPEKLDKLTESLIKSDGAADKMAKTMLNNTKGAVEEMMGAAETLGITIYQSTANPLKSLAETGAGYINQLTEAFKGSGITAENESQRIEDGLISVNDGFSSTSGSAKSMAETFGSILSDIASKLVNSAPDMIKSGTELMNSFFNGLQSADIGKAAGTTIVALIDSFMQFTGRFLSFGIEIITQIISGIASNSDSLRQTGVETITKIMTSLTESLPTLITSGSQILSSILTGLIQSIPLITPVITQLITGIGTILTENLPLLLTAGLELIKAIAQGILEAIPTMIPTILNLITTLVDFVIANLPLIIDLGLQIIMAIAQGLIDNLPWFIETLPRLINEFTNGLMAQLPKILAMGLSIILELGKGLIENLPLLIANIPAIVMAVINAFTLMDFWSLGGKLIENIKSGVLNVAGNLKAAVGNLSKSITGGIESTFKYGLDLGKNLISNIKNGVLSIGESLAILVKTIGARAMDFIRNAFSGAFNIGSTLISNIKGGVLSIGTSIQIALSSIATNAINAVKNIFSGAASIGSNLIRGIWSGISNMTGWILNLIGGFASSVIGGIKSFFGIKSPSKIMEKEVGKWLPPGIAIGFDDAMPALNRDIDKQINGLTKRMETEVQARANMTGAKLAANSNVYLPNPYDRKSTKDGSSAMVMGDIHTTVDLDGRVAGYGVARYSSEEMALDDKRRQY